ncbi:MAG: hypothetical protein ACREMM_12975 [Gemmatimonadales bacterium]
MRKLCIIVLCVLVPAPRSLLPQQVATVEVAPAHASVTAGATSQFRATARDTAGRVIMGPPIEWFATPFDIAGADSTGLVTTFRPGQTYVFAVVGGKPGFGVPNLYAADGMLYMGAYNGGIRVLDVSGELRGDLRAQGRVIGSVYTGSLDGYRPNTALAWSAIPHRGYVFGSDVNTGLWVAKVR